MVTHLRFAPSSQWRPTPFKKPETNPFRFKAWSGVIDCEGD